MNNEENLLIIGNGFDLAHDLPTKYIDFLEFSRYVLKLRAVKNLKENECYDSRILRRDFENEKNFENEDVKKFLVNNQDILKELIGLLEDNVWISYFQNRANNQKENWIDFESEIADVIKLLEEARKEYYKLVLIKTDSIDTNENRMEMEAYRKFRKYMGKSDMDDAKITANIFVKIKERLLEDLEKLTEALEIYLGEYVEKIKLKLYSEDILQINPRYILSFNYTNTYKRIYHMNYDMKLYSYIHGKIRDNKKEDCNIILGIDEYMNEKEREKNIEFIEFQKYYQRVQKKTIFEFNKWKEKLGDAKLNIYIFGHSLDITDKDILKSFLENEKYKINIFYKDKKAYGSQIANLVKLIGQSQLLNKLENQIKFIKQTEMRQIKNSSLEIHKDINKMRKINELNQEEMKKFLSKISRKIKNQDVDYFKNQQNIINLFLAMDNWDLVNKKCVDLMLGIVKKIPDKYHFRAKEWGDVLPDGKLSLPDAKFRWFIKEINAINEKNKNTKRVDEDNIWDQYELKNDMTEDELRKLLNVSFEYMDNKNIYSKIKHIVINNYSSASKVLDEMKMDEKNSRYVRIQIIYLLRQCEAMEYIENSGMLTNLDDNN